MKRLIRCTRWLIVALFSMGMAACGVLRATLAPTPTPAVVRVSADQIAKAMQDDEFYSDYRGDILHVTGTVAAVSQENGQTVVELETSIPTTVRCYLDDPSTAPQVGATVTLEAAAAEGQREDSAIGLLHCKMIGP